MRREERRQRLAGAGRRRDERVPPLRDRVPPRELRVVGASNRRVNHARTAGWKSSNADIGLQF